MPKTLNSFPPLIFPDSEFLILGTMPGVKSLENNQYYANPGNQFWKLLSSSLNKAIPMNYEEKLNLIKNNKLALWDVLLSCEREGSSDAKIINPVPNNFHDLFKKYPQIKTIYFTSQKASSLFEKFYRNEFLEIKKIILPSPSALYTIQFEKKLEKWKELIG